LAYRGLDALSTTPRLIKPGWLFAASSCPGDTVATLRSTMPSRERRVATLRYFTDCLRAEGVGPGGVDWASASSQQTRFAALLDLLKDDPQRPPAPHVLDVGCGFADLYPLLLHEWPDLRYTGCDLSTDHLAVAQARYPRAALLCQDIEDLLHEAPPGQRWDYALISGTFNLRTPRWERWVVKTLEGLWARCRRGVAFNLLDRAVPRPPTVVTVSPAYWAAWCSRLSAYSWLRDDYLPGDVTFFLLRSPPRKAR